MFPSIISRLLLNIGLFPTSQLTFRDSITTQVDKTRPRKVKRKLTAILSSDVKGYSRLMGGDEEATVHTLNAYKEVMTKLTQQYRGRVVDAPGDNVLAEFASVVDAVRCAVEIQKEIKTRNAELPENRRMEFRIGVNLGDVIEDGEQILGDGVNIAARLESLSEAGGICISGTAFDQVENKLSLEYEYLGEQSVKNIAKPVRVYRVLMEPGAVVRKGLEVTSKEMKSLTLPDKPSIAVLPFVNMSGDPEQEYFSDGITEDLITDLSKISSLFVIARNSVFTYKGRAVKVDHVGRELGVRYVLEGSVRKAGARVRITAQLVDASTGGHLWAERYDRNVGDIFALQDEVTQKIVTALAVKLTRDEQERLERRYTNNLEAYDCLLQGLGYFYLYTKDGNDRARTMFDKAIDLDPEFALAYGRLGLTYWLEWSFGWSQSLECLEKAFQLAQKAAELDDSLPQSHSILGMVCLWKKEHEQAIGHLQRAISLDPNNADALDQLAHILTFAGRPEEAIGLEKKAMRLNPLYPSLYEWTLGHAYFLLGEYEQAIAALRRVLDRSPGFHPAHIYLALSLTQLGRMDESKAEAAEFMRVTPSMSWESWKQRLPYKNKAILEGLFETLIKAMVKPW
jgi:adenylate cyclase